MGRKRIASIILMATVLIAELMPADVFALNDAGGGGGDGILSPNTAQASISFEYGNNSVDRDWYDTAGEKCIPVDTHGTYRSENGNDPCSYRAAPKREDDDTKEDKIDNILGRGRLAVKVTYSEKDGQKIIDGSTVNITGSNISDILSTVTVGAGYYNKNTGKPCTPSPTASYGSECVYRDGETRYYELDGDRNIVIKTKEGGMSCKILTGSGNTLEAFNQSMKDCAGAMNSWTQRCGEIVAGDATICSFGKIEFKDINGNTEILNEEELSGDAKDAIEKAAENGNSGDVCINNGGALSWVICPVVQMAADFSQWFYESVIEPQLQIQASGIFEADGGVYQAWSGFRDIANIVFVVLFLVIIISQLTGYGIDNYGIKRMLPRLIIAAILINLSYFICQLAVDAANIIGISIGSFLSGFVEPQELKGSSPDAGQYLFTFAAGAAISVGVVMVGGLGAVISILITAVSVLISLMVLLAILTARQAAIIILIVISPIALVCYLLPNTEGLTKKWLKIAEAMLLLYPICSLVIAASSLAGNVVASAAGDNAGMYIAAILVQVIPYLAIPSLVKNSMAGLGNLGARISNLGQRASRGATTALNKSEAIKGIRTSLNAVGTKENGFRSRILGKTAMGRRHLGKQNLEAAQRRQAMDKAERMGRPGWSKMIDKNLADENRKESAKILQSTYEGMSDKSLQNEFTSALTDKGAFEDGRIDALVNTYMDKGDYDGLYDALKNAETSGASHSAMKRAADAMKANRNFGELSAKRTSLGEWAKSDQVLDNGNGVSVAMYNNMGSFKPKDWASMNGAERDLAFDKLEDMKNDPYYAEDYKAAAKSMREAINNENLRGNMAPETIKKYKDFSDNVLGPESQQPVTPQAPVLRLGDMSTAEYTASSAEQRKALREGEGTTSVGWQELSRMATEYKDNPQLAATASGNAQREMAFYNDLNDKIKDKNSFETISDDDLEHLVNYAASNSVAGLEHIRRVASDAVNDSEIVSNLQSRGPTKAGGLSGADRLDALRTLANGGPSPRNGSTAAAAAAATAAAASRADAQNQANVSQTMNIPHQLNQNTKTPSAQSTQTPSATRTTETKEKKVKPNNTKNSGKTLSTKASRHMSNGVSNANATVDKMKSTGQNY